MIVLLTDFGIEGPYIGQVQMVLYRKAPGIPVINLFSDLPAFNPRAVAYLLPAYTQNFPDGSVFLCVVDPGVGSEREAVVLKADGRWYVGPDNGLFNVLCKQAQEIQQWHITFAPERLSSSFHARDIFAPVAAKLAMGLPVPGKLCELDKRTWAAWPDDLYEIIYIDRYGNAMTGVRASQLQENAVLEVKKRKLAFARTFADAHQGQPFWYYNANSLVELALKESNIGKELSLEMGDAVHRHE